MSYGEHVLLAEVVVEQKAANCTQGRFYERFNISLICMNVIILVRRLICILLFGYVIWRTRFIS